MAPTVLIDSGHRSRNSKTKGRQRNTDSIQPAHVVKNCGEVPTITSGRRCTSPARKPLTMKDR